MQNRLESFREACTNTAIGFTVNLLGQYIIFPLVGLQVSFGQHILVSTFFTFLSIARGYVIRRWFNGLTVRKYNVPTERRTAA